MGRFNDALDELGTAEAMAKASGNAELADIILRGPSGSVTIGESSTSAGAYLERRIAYQGRERSLGTPSLNKVYALLYSGLLDIKTGDVTLARKKFADIRGPFRLHRRERKEFQPAGLNLLKREVLFAEGDYDGAVRVFKEGPPVKINLAVYMTVQQKNLPFQADFAARAFAKKGETDKAVAEYERLVSPDSGVREGAP